MKLLRQATLVGGISLMTLSGVIGCSDDSGSDNGAAEVTPNQTNQDKNNPNDDQPQSQSPEFQLVRAIQANDPESFRQILNEQDNDQALLTEPINEIDSEEGLTLLMIAAKWGRFAIARYLVEDVGVDPKQQNPDGLTPAYYAKINGFNVLFRYLESDLEGVDLNEELYAAARQGLSVDIRLYDALGADTNYVKEGGGSILMASVVSNQPEAVKLVLNLGANPQQTVTVRGRDLTALQYAQATGANPAIITILEEATANAG